MLIIADLMCNKIAAGSGGLVFPMYLSEKQITLKIDNIAYTCTVEELRGIFEK